MAQIARDLTDCFDGFLRGTRNLILDCDPLYTREVCRMMRGGFDKDRTGFILETCVMTRRAL